MVAFLLFHSEIICFYGHFARYTLIETIIEKRGFMEVTYFVERKKHLEKRIAELEKRREKYPHITICAHNDGSFTRWSVYDDHNSNKRKYLPKNRKPLARLLARKKLESIMLKDMQNELNCINLYIDRRKEIDWTWLLAKDSAYRELLINDEWENQPYEQKDDHPENLIHQGPKGELMRSKAESIIAFLLYERGIPYHYEEVHHFGKIKIGSDFTIKHPTTGQTYIWEHFGMAEKESYQQDIAFKIPNYIKAGFIPGINLITTYETNTIKMDIAKIKKLVEEYFC